MKILITNDDGFESKGIRHLTELASEFSDDIVVIAPDKSYSGMSHAITMHSPIFVKKSDNMPYGIMEYVCNGSPVDCIKVGLDELLRETPPDLILSGINHGSNSNVSVLYSGTMGAATEGALYGIPSIGFSLTDHSLDADFSGAIEYSRKIISSVVALPLHEQSSLCLNVNIPNIPVEDIRGIKVCRQTIGLWRENFIIRQDPHNRTYFWMNGSFLNSEPEATDNDEWALKNGYVSVVPVKMDMTDYNRLGNLRL